MQKGEILPHTYSRRRFLQGLGATGFLAALTSCTGVPEVRVKGLPSQSVWVTYPTGTGTYNDVAAIANMVTDRSGMRVRLMTSNNGIGRLGPVISGTAQYARTGDEYFYAFNADDEYASENWGPQKIRQIWAPVGNYGVLVRKDSGIRGVSDLKGKKYPRLISSTSMNRKLEAILHFGGLTVDDVEWVDIAYSEQAEAMKTGQIDAMYQNVVGATIEELNTEYPIHWLDLGGGTPEQYSTWEELAPNVIPGEFSNAVGQKPGETCTNMQYSIPIVTTSDQPKEEVAAIIDLLVKHYGDYKDSTADAHRFSDEKVLLTPMVVPFHEASVEHFKKIDRWSPDLQRRQDALLEHERLLHEAWPGFWEENKKADNPAALWKEWKKKNLPPLPPVNDVSAPKV